MMKKSRYRPKKKGAKESDFLFTTLLQSLLCAVLIAFAFVAGNILELTTVKEAYAVMLSEEAEAVEVLTSLEQVMPRHRHWKEWGKRFLEWIMGEEFTATFTLPSGAPPVAKTSVVLSAPLTLPLTGEKTSEFGWREDPFTQKQDFHRGVDLAAAHGTPIGAGLSGIVSETGKNEIDGWFVTLDHGGFFTRYCHCSALAVAQGDQIAQGETIAWVGSTGRTTGAHLHWELLVGEKIADPLYSPSAWQTL